jgi:hypothetical protein
VVKLVAVVHIVAVSGDGAATHSLFAFLFTQICFYRSQNLSRKLITRWIRVLLLIETQGEGHMRNYNCETAGQPREPAYVSKGDVSRYETSPP